ncbi:hypothetical protein [Streptomyces sp. HNM0574]|uniref:hypothetical protein n=1 Tax=Streptomyces sp. HNM0574 TaxID=2714954 RepID=UPI00146A8781|nr:hypothetical protein [Streptomyces sp. HNM0574]NLU68486.1 hypothetical protein [Streptomyces sp. HNM0574]
MIAQVPLHGLLRGACTAALVAALTVSATACSKLQTQSPEGHSERLEKAAGVSDFKITTSRDLWDHTRDSPRSGKPIADLSKAKVTRSKESKYLVDVHLTGTQLVQYLRDLDHQAHRGEWGGNSDPIAVRTYDALAPVVDSIKKGERPKAVPTVVIDDSPASPSSAPAGPDSAS